MNDLNKEHNPYSILLKLVNSLIKTIQLSNLILPTKGQGSKLGMNPPKFKLLKSRFPIRKQPIRTIKLLLFLLQNIGYCHVLGEIVAGDVLVLDVDVIFDE
jgi:hypothetical protein